MSYTGGYDVCTSKLAPKYWAETRARLDPQERDLPLGEPRVPEPAAKQAPTG